MHGFPGRRLPTAAIALVIGATVVAVVTAIGTSTTIEPAALRTEALTVATTLFLVLAVFCIGIATWALRGIDVIFDGAARPRPVIPVVSALVVLPYCYGLAWFLGYYRETGSATASLGRVATALPYLPLADVSVLVVIVAVARLRAGWDPAQGAMGIGRGRRSRVGAGCGAGEPLCVGWGHRAGGHTRPRAAHAPPAAP